MISTVRRLLERRATPLAPRRQVALTVVAALAVAAMAAWAWSSTNITASSLAFLPLAASLLMAAPISLLLKAAEFDIAARINSQNPTRGRALRVAGAAAIANLLPLPGSMLVTVRSLSEDGASYRDAISSGAIPGLAWLAITGTVGGAAIAVAGSPVTGAVVAVAGLSVGVGVIIMFRSAAPTGGRARLASSIVVVEFGWLATSALRLWLAAEALGQHIGLSQALALSVAGAVTVAVGFLPGGLGLREFLVAALSPLIGIPFNTGVLMASVDRLVWLVFLAVVALWLSASNRRPGSDRPIR